MIHPEFKLYRNRPQVQVAAKAYREAWRAHDGSFESGAAVKQAETALNLAIEKAVMR